MQYIDGYHKSVFISILMFLAAATNDVSLQTEDSKANEHNFDKGVSPKLLYSISDTFNISI